jgi:serine/threonine protein kinase
VPPLTPELLARSISSTRNLTFIGAVGAGAFKDTFQVQDGAGTSLALKIYRAAGASERARRELEAMYRCAHPHIGRLFTVDVHVEAAQNVLYTLEEFLPGGTLALRISNALLTPIECYSLGIPLIDAITHIAALDLVHRDLKPDNIIFRADGSTPVITDFGLVRDLAAGSLTPTFAMPGPGTPLYASPEQLLNSKPMIDWRADQFSLGVLLAFGTLGSHPYAEPGDAYGDTVSRVAQRLPTSTRFRNEATSAGLPALITMTEPWPHQRYRTPSQLASAWAAQPAGSTSQPGVP